MTLNDAARGRGPKAGVNNWMSSVRLSWRISSKEWEKGDFTDFQVRVSLLSASLSSKQQDGNETNDIRSRTVSKQEVQDRQGDAKRNGRYLLDRRRRYRRHPTLRSNVRHRREDGGQRPRKLGGSMVEGAFTLADHGRRKCSDPRST